MRPMSAVPAFTPMQKPLLRGVSHQIAFFLSWPALAWLLHRAQGRIAVLAAAIYGAALVGLLGVSALYHRVNWDPARRALLKRLDHSTIFLLIAGTYTPICLLGVGGPRGQVLLAAIWAGALLGIGQTLFWPGAPRALHVGIYVLVGWAGAFGLSAEAARIGVAGAASHLLGGVLYTAGAVAYARRRPDPFPRVFGYHEIFHALVVLACACLFDVVRRCVELG